MLSASVVVLNALFAVQLLILLIITLFEGFGSDFFFFFFFSVRNEASSGSPTAIGLTLNLSL